MWRLIQKLNQLFRPAKVTRGRVIFAIAVAVGADGLQILLQLLPGAPVVIDIVAMLLTTAALGFHVLLLPTFALEFIPVVDMLPTWTGCVIAVIGLRRADRNNQPPPAAAAPPVISRAAAEGNSELPPPPVV